MQPIPEPVRLLAEFPISHGPEPAAASPAERIRTARYALLFVPGPNGQMVEPLDARDDVPSLVAEVRAAIRARDRDVAIWFVPSGTRPADMKDRLLGLGLARATEPPWEPRFSAMALTEPPASGPSGVVARRPRSFEEFDAAIELEAEIVGIPEEDRRAGREHRRTIWELHEGDGAVMRLFVALVDGEIAGLGRAMLAEAGVNLGGGVVRPSLRGRGIYRALIHARWETAVERGTPALTVQAGRMSRPILERVGFEIVGEQHCLVDRFEA